MRIIQELGTKHIDEEQNTMSIDAFFTDDNMEEGRCIAKVCLDTGKTFWRDTHYRNSQMVLNAIKERLMELNIAPYERTRKA